MIYPVVLLHAGVLLPGLVKIVLAVDRKAAIIHILMILLGLYAVAVVMFFVFRNLVRTASTSAGVDGFLRKIPIVSKVRRSLSMSRFCKVMQIHLLAGQRMDTSLTAAAEASQSGQILDSVIHQVVPAVKDGDHAGKHFDQRIFQPTFIRSYKTAEEAGTLDTDMERWSKASHGEAVLAMDRLAAAAPKILYGLVVVYVVYQIFGMFSGYVKAITNLL
jgi:type II secretory pathway component PulF